jgi:transcriptional regulator with XRE-family HTH domain
MNRCAAFGAGRKRQPWRIREFLDEQGLTQADVARELGKNRSTVNRTIRGSINNRDVLKYLYKLGCHERYLSLPDDLKEWAKQEEKAAA